MADGLNDLLDDLETGGGSFTREQRAEIKRAVNRFAKRQKKDTKNALGDTPKTPSALEQEEAQLEKGKEKFLPKKRWPMKPAALDTTFADQYSEAYKTIREAGSKPAEFITSFTGLLQLEGQLANFLSAVAEGTFANEDVRKMVANGLKSYITAYIGRTIVNKEGELLKEVAKNDMPGYATAILEKVKDQIAVPRIPPNIKKPDAAVPVVPGPPKDATAKPSRLGSLVSSAKSMVQSGVDRMRGKSPDAKTPDGKTPETTPKTPGKFEKLNTVLKQKFDVIRGKKREDEKAKKEEAAKGTPVPGAPPPPTQGAPPPPTQGAPPPPTPGAPPPPTPGAPQGATPVVQPPASAPPAPPPAQVPNGQLAQDHNAKIAADVQAHIQKSELKGKTGLIETQQKLEHNVQNIAASKAKGEELKAKDAQLKQELTNLQKDPNVTVAQLEKAQKDIEKHQTVVAKNEKDTSKLEKRQDMLGKRAATETKLLDKTGFNKASTSEKGAYYAKSSLRSANKTMKSAASSLSKLGSKLKKSFTRKAPLDPAAKAAADAAAKDAYVQKQQRKEDLKGKSGQALEEAKLKHAQEDQAAAAAKQTQLQQQYEALKKSPAATTELLKEKEKEMAKVDQVKQAVDQRIKDKTRNVTEMGKATTSSFRDNLYREKVARLEETKATSLKEKEELLREQNKIRQATANTPAEKAEQQAKIEGLDKQMAAKDKIIATTDASLSGISPTRTIQDNVKDFGYRAKASARSAKQSLLSASESAAAKVGKAFAKTPPLSPEQKAEQKQAAEKASMDAFKLKQNREVDLLGKTGKDLEAAKFKHATEDQAAAVARKAVLQQEYEALKKNPNASIDTLKQKESELAKQDQLLQTAQTRIEEKRANYNEMLNPSTYAQLKAAKRSAKQSFLKTADRTGRALAKTGKAIKGAVSGSDAAQAARDANLALSEAAASTKEAVQNAASATGTAAASAYGRAKGAVQSAAESAQGAVQSAQGAVQSAAPGLQRAASFGKDVALTTGKVALGVGAAAALGAAVGTAHAAEPLLAIAQYARDSSASRSAASRAAKGIAPRTGVDPMSLTAAVGHARRLTKLVLADALQKYAYLESEDEKTKAKALKEVKRLAAQKQAEYEEKKRQVNRSFQSVALLKKKRANLQKQLDALHSAEDPDQTEIDEVEHAFEMADHDIQRQEVEMEDFKNDLRVEQSKVDQTRAEVQIVQQKLHPETVVAEEISEPPLAEAYVVPDNSKPDRSHLNETIKNGKRGYDIGGKRTRRRPRKARAKAKARPRRAQTKQRPCGTKKGRTRFISEDCFL